MAEAMKPLKEVDAQIKPNDFGPVIPKEL